MKYIIFIVGLSFSIYITSFICQKDYNVSLMSRQHTQIAKGVSIFFVLFAHIGGLLNFRYFTPLGGIGVTVFLIVTGFGLNESFKKKGLSKYWRSKIANVWFPFFLIRIIILLYEHLILGTEINAIKIVKDIFLIDIYQPYGWYLQLLFFWYVVFYIISSLFKHNKLRVFILLIISLSFVFFPNGLWAEQAISFIAGVMMSEVKSKEGVLEKYFSSKKILIFFISTGLLSLLLKQFDFVRELPSLIYNIVELTIKFPLGLALLIVIFSYQKIFNNSFISIMGKYSYSIYLIHAYTILFLVYPTYLNIIIFFIITFLSTMLFNWIIKFIIN